MAMGRTWGTIVFSIRHHWTLNFGISLANIIWITLHQWSSSNQLTATRSSPGCTLALASAEGSDGAAPTFFCSIRSDMAHGFRWKHQKDEENMRVLSYLQHSPTNAFLPKMWEKHTDTTKALCVSHRTIVWDVVCRLQLCKREATPGSSHARLFSYLRTNLV